MYSSCSKNVRNAEVLLTKAKPNREKAKTSHSPILKLILSASVSSLPKALDTFVMTASENPFVLLARITVKEGLVDAYLEIAEEV